MEQKEETIQNRGESQLPSYVKMCQLCKESKASSEFHRTSKNKDGLKYICKSCSKMCDRAYREKNQEKIRANRAKTLERRRETKRKWNSLNKEHVKEYQKEYQERPEVKERSRQKAYEYYHDNRERVAVMTKRKRREDPVKKSFAKSKTKE